MFQRHALTKFRAFIPLAAILLAAGCATTHVATTTDYSHSANFAAIHTYSWLRVNAGDDLWADRIQRNVNTQLAARGWTLVPSGGDVQVAAFGATRVQPSLETFYSGFGPGFGGWYWQGWGPAFATTQVVYTPVGSVTVDIFDNATKHLIWRGTLQHAISRRPERNEDRLATGFARMFRNFPPNTPLG